MRLEFATRMGSMGPSAIRDLTARTQNPDIISFAAGLPAPQLFPVEEIKKAYAKVLNEQGSVSLQYSPTDGYVPLRELVVQRMKSAGIHLEVENVVITSGAQQGLDFTGRMFINEGDTIIVESPSYVGAINCLKVYSPKIIPVSMDEEGMIIEELEKALEENPDAKLIYTIPDFQNPTGRTMSVKRRRKMIELAVKYNTPIFEDSPYSELIFEGDRMPAIKSFDTTGHVIYSGSFSKTLCPGLRIGWIAANKEIIQKHVYIKQRADLHTNNLAQRQVVELCKIYDFDAHIEKINEYYKAKKDVMIETMKKEFPQNVKFTNPKGGIFLWVTLPDGMDATEILERGFENNVAFVPGEPFFPFGGHKNTFRLNYVSETEDRIVEGVTRLGKILKDI